LTSITKLNIQYAHRFLGYIGEAQGIKDGSPFNTSVGVDFDNDLAKAYPKYRLVVVKKVATVENLIEVFYSLFVARGLIPRALARLKRY
jgi:hypothetical protein